MMLRRQEVEVRCGISKATLYRLMHRRGFPKPLQVGPNAVRWVAREVDEWLASRPRACVDEVWPEPQPEAAV